MNKLILLFMMVFLFVSCVAVDKKKRQIQVKDIVAQNNAKWSYCYKKALQKNKNLEGDMNMEWEVFYSGGREKVRNIKVQSTSVRSQDLVHCMKKAIATMKFDFPEKRQIPLRKVSYPFTFKNDIESTLKR